MKVAILNMEPKYTNLALEKIKMYHEDKGDEVEQYIALLDSTYDKIYCSSLFDFTPKDHLIIDHRWSVGGTGFDFKCEDGKTTQINNSKLPLEIETLNPKINIGFTTRGCIRRCSFCVVPLKEGKIYPVGDIYDIWDSKSKEIELLDNNIMGMHEHFKKIWGQIKKEKLKIKENGLDIRILDKEKAEILASVRHYEYKFAFDGMEYERYVLEGIKTLKDAGIKQSTFYVLVGYNTTIEQDLYRLELLKSHGQNAYLMRYKREKIYVPMARWSNQKHIFKKMTFKQFLELDENKNYLTMYKDYI